MHHTLPRLLHRPGPGGCVGLNMFNRSASELLRNVEGWILTNPQVFLPTNHYITRCVVRAGVGTSKHVSFRPDLWKQSLPNNPERKIGEGPDTVPGKTNNS